MYLRRSIISTKIVCGKLALMLSKIMSAQFVVNYERDDIDRGNLRNVVTSIAN